MYRPASIAARGCNRAIITAAGERPGAIVTPVITEQGDVLSSKADVLSSKGGVQGGIIAPDAAAGLG